MLTLATLQTVLGIPHRVLYRSRLWWHKPDEFHPERWLPDEQRPKEFDNDRRDGFHPFSYGPRQCIAVKYEKPHAPCFETMSSLKSATVSLMQRCDTSWPGSYGILISQSLKRVVLG